MAPRRAAQGRPCAATTWPGELGIDRGPELGRLLEAVREAVFAGEVQDRDQAVSYARAFVENPQR